MTPFQHPSERDFNFSPLDPSHLASSRLIESATRCHFIFGGDSRSSSTDSRSVADGEAELINVTGSKNARVLDDSVLLERDAQIGGARTGNVGAGGTAAGGDVQQTEIGSITVNDTGGEVLTQALDKVTEFAALSEASRQAAQQGLLTLSQQSISASAETAAESTEKLAQLLDALAEAKTETDPEARKDNTVLWLVLGLLAFLFFKLK